MQTGFKQQGKLYKCGIAILGGGGLFKLDWLLKIVLESQNRRTGKNFIGAAVKRILKGV